MIEDLESRRLFTGVTYYISSSVLMVQMNDAHYVSVTLTGQELDFSTWTATIRDSMGGVIGQQTGGISYGVHIIGTEDPDSIVVNWEIPGKLNVEAKDGGDSIYAVGDMSNATISGGGGDDGLDAISAWFGSNSTLQGGAGDNDNAMFADGNYPTGYDTWEYRSWW
jgi:hypothetical protein